MIVGAYIVLKVGWANERSIDRSIDQTAAMIDRKSGTSRATAMSNRVSAKIQSNSINRGIGNLPALFAAALAALYHCMRPGIQRLGSDVWHQLANQLSPMFTRD